MLFTNIQRICNEKHVAITNIEKLAGLSPNSMYRWDSAMPSVDKVVRVARVLGTTVEDLLNDKESINP